MDAPPPQPAASAEPARWLTERIDPWGPGWVTNLVGWGFPACARLFHPLDFEPSSRTWASTARANRRRMHSSAEWDKISVPASTAAGKSRTGRGHPGDPMWGNLHAWALKALCDILTRYTTTPEACYFALWGGWGWLHPNEFGVSSTVTSYYAPDGVMPEVQPPASAPAEWQLDLSGPTFAIENRDHYRLFEGHVRQALGIGTWVNESFFIGQSPQFFWPADHAWCVVTEIDYDSTFVGGSSELIDELCASKTLEVLEIPPDVRPDDLNNS